MCSRSSSSRGCGAIPSIASAGLLIGADDYMVKPLDLNEFVVRARKLIARGLPADTHVASLLTSA